MLDGGVADVLRPVGRRQQSGVPAQERVDPRLHRQGEVLRGRGDVLDVAEAVGLGRGDLEGVLAVGVGDRVGPGAREVDVEAHPAEDHLVTLGDGLVGEGRFQAADQRRPSAPGQVDVGVGQEVERLHRPVLGEADRAQPVGHLPGQEGRVAEGLLEVEALLEPQPVAVLVPRRETVRAAGGADGDQAARRALGDHGAGDRRSGRHDGEGRERGDRRPPGPRGSRWV